MTDDYDDWLPPAAPAPQLLEKEQAMKSESSTTTTVGPCAALIALALIIAVNFAIWAGFIWVTVQTLRATGVIA